MAQEDKQLQLIDLCARLPYKPVIQVSDWTLLDAELEVGHIARLMNEDLELKPYLRSMSNMTEEDLRDFAKIKFEHDALWEIVEFPKIKCYKRFINVKCKNKNSRDTWIFQVNTRTPLETYYGIDWLLSRHFDIRGLIPMGLALEAPKDMYKTE